MKELINHLERLYGLGVINIVQLDVISDAVFDSMLNDTFGDVGNNRRIEFDG